MAKTTPTRTNEVTQSSMFPTAFDPFARMRAEMDDLFGRYLRPAPMNGTNGAMLAACDVAETEKAYEFKLDVPGISRDDIDIDFEQGRLTISGERHAEEVTEEKSYRRAERSYGAFSTGFALPADVDGNKIHAELKDGVLTVTVPKSDNARKTARKITVKSG